MKKDDLLGLFLRCLGAWVGVQGIKEASLFIATPAAALAAVPDLLVGAILFFGAGYLVQLTYGPRRAEVAD